MPLDEHMDLVGGPLDEHLRTVRQSDRAELAHLQVMHDARALDLEEFEDALAVLHRRAHYISAGLYDSAVVA